MNKTFLLFLCFSSIVLYSQTTKINNPISYKASNDHEFDKGSKISIGNLNESKIEDLVILGKVWGFLKYYHPSISGGRYNWDYELFRILPKILESKNQNERNKILSFWVDSLGKFESGVPISLKGRNVKLYPDLNWIENSELGEKLTVQLTNIKNAKRTDESYYIGLVEGIGNPDFKNENNYKEIKYDDAGFRLLCLYRYWNIIQYYFPYKNLIEENWADILKEFIPKFANVSSELDYKLTLLSLIARIHDSHANIWKDATLRNCRGINYAPVIISFVEDKAVVTGYYDKTSGTFSGLKIGDVIEKINNKPVEEIVKEKLPYASASNYTTQLRVIASNLLSTNDSILTIEYQRGKEKRASDIRCFSGNTLDIYGEHQKLDTCFKNIGPDIAYLFPGSIKKEYVSKFISQILKAKGLIIDLRSYPSDNIVYELNNYLLPQKITCVIATRASISMPGLFMISDSLESGKKNEDFYKGKVIIIVNENTQSQGECDAMAFKTITGAKVIGSTTAGADGDVSRFKLPGNILTGISGIGIYYPDGRETQRIGIVPDIVVKPTIIGITEGKDELLEKAIEIINGD